MILVCARFVPSPWRRAIAALVLIAAPAFAPAAEPIPALPLPVNGSHTLRVISPTVLELTSVIAGSNKVPGDHEKAVPPEVPAFAPADFRVTVDGAPVEVKEIGFRRRVVYAPFKQRDLRIGQFIYLRLAAPLPADKKVDLAYTGSAVPWLAKAHATARSDRLRESPAIHVNQAGYAPESTKLAMVGYYLGTLKELEVPESTEFEIVDARSNKTVHKGKLTARPDRGMPFGWYQHVREANFSDVKAPGAYRLVVPGLGASWPFVINEGLPALLARTYALGLYHQRCGTTNAMPFTRFTHDACHTAPAEVPTVSVRSLKGFDETAPDADLYPYVRKGKIDVSGGHHDAGDYSKYTINTAALVHHLVFAADSLAGAGELDNLGLPESGDGKSDLLQCAKWEADFLAKLQDEDGGFYFLVYPRDRRYEHDVLPEKGDPQIVWPKNTAATGAAVAALAQCASSPKFRTLFPDDAKRYLEIARRGWKFLMAAEQKRSGDTYRRFTHYGDDFKDADEIAWAACELFFATGEPEFETELFTRFPNPRDPATRRWGWRMLTDSYGAVIRSYAFAAKSGRVPKTKLARNYLMKCEDEIIACAEDWLKAARDSAYGVSYADQSKRRATGGWHFSSDNAFDLAVASQLDFPPKADRRPAFRDAIVSNFNYDLGTNPVGVCFVTGLGWKRPSDIVHHYAQNDRRAMPLSGIPLGSIQSGFSWLEKYRGDLGAQSFPSDEPKAGSYPTLDRWGDSFNLQSEFVITNQGRALAAAAWLMAQSPLRDQKWKPVAGEIEGIGKTAKAGERLTLKLTAPGIDLTDAQIVWEGRDLEPVFAGSELALTPKQAGAQWVEAEAQLPDGRRVFAVANFTSSGK